MNHESTSGKSFDEENSSSKISSVDNIFHGEHNVCLQWSLKKNEEEIKKLKEENLQLKTMCDSFNEDKENAFRYLEELRNTIF